jgi:phosphoribosylformimino-5-aminoimidazole carboxamide ribotide isomerase
MIGGKPGTEKVYGEPVERAERWVAEGAECLHVVDLDAALGKGDNIDKIAEIMEGIGVQVQVGGGIRKLERACELLELGADRVIIGTAAVSDPEFVKKLVEMVGGARVLVAIDSRGRKVVVKGWKQQTDLSPVALGQELEEMGVGGLLFTSVDVEGGMKGAAVSETKEIVEAVEIPVIASGGVGSLEDVQAIKETGAAGLVVGMALYEGKFTLVQAMEVAEE